MEEDWKDEVMREMAELEYRRNQEIAEELFDNDDRKVNYHDE